MAKAILCDLDGTLIDSEPWHKQAEIQAFREFGIELAEADLAPYVGTTLPHMLEGLGARFGVAISTDAFREFGQPVLSRFVRDRIELFPDVEPFLARTVGLPRALVTSSMRWYVDEVLDRFPVLRASFATIVCQADVVHGKPNPEGYRLAAGRLAFEPADCLAIEDSANGVQAALAAGCRVVGIDREGIGWLSHADRVVSTLTEIGLEDGPKMRAAPSA